MQFVTVNFALNQKYHVEKSAFLQVVKKAIMKLAGVKFISSDVVIDSAGEQLKIFIEAAFDGTKPVNEMINLVTSSVERSIQDLIDTKPKNIQIVIKGVK